MMRPIQMSKELMLSCGSALTGFALIAAIALTAANVVPTTRMGTSTRAINADALKPAGCVMTLTTLVTGAGVINGTGGADLILTGTGIDSPSGGNGSDCIVAGGGNDTVSGGNGNDVLYGGPGADTVNGGAGTDVCYGGDGIDVFVGCETEVQ